MKKVLHILSSNIFSGAENVVCQIISMFEDEENYEMVYCSPKGAIGDILCEKKIKYIPIDKMSIKEIRRVIKLYKPDIIHAHDGKASVITACVCGDIKLISHIHGNHDNMKVLSIKSISYLLASKKFKHIIWVSNSCLGNYKYKKYVKHKSSILYNVINIKNVIDKMNEDKENYNYDCVFLGRLCDIKNPKRLIRILYNVSKKHKNFTSAIIGDGELYEECKLLINELDLNNSVYLLGYKKNPYKILYNSKVMLMTSKYEGTPMCALEAMSLGVPIVSTPTDGIVDILEHGITGYLDNDDEQLVDNIVSIISNNVLYDKMSRASYMKAKELNNIEKYKDRLNKIYF